MASQKYQRFALVVAVGATVPLRAIADPVTTGPFYLPHNAEVSDRKEAIELISSVQAQFGSPVYLCSTLASIALGNKRQKAVRAELIASGTPSNFIRVGPRCSEALRRPAIEAGAKDSVVAIIGPSDL